MKTKKMVAWQVIFAAIVLWVFFRAPHFMGEDKIVPLTITTASMFVMLVATAVLIPLTISLGAAIVASLAMIMAIASLNGVSVAIVVAIGTVLGIIFLAKVVARRLQISRRVATSSYLVQFIVTLLPILYDLWK